MGEVWLFRVVIWLSGTIKNFKLGQFFYIFKSYMTLLYLLLIVFFKIWSINSDSDGLFVNLGPNVKI